MSRRMCVRCERITDHPVLIQEVHGASGPGWNVYACPDCAPHYPPLPDDMAVTEGAPRPKARLQ